MSQLYYLIQLTWGLPLNIIGAITFLVLIKVFNQTPYKFRKMYCIAIPWNFGGVNLGMFAIHGKNNYAVVSHEYGHSIQNLIWGWLTPFVITIPSAIRYWDRTIHNKSFDDYYDIWFEKQATEFGELADQNKWSFI